MVVHDAGDAPVHLLCCWVVIRGITRWLSKGKLSKVSCCEVNRSLISSTPLVTPLVHRNQHPEKLLYHAVTLSKLYNNTTQLARVFHSSRSSSSRSSHGDRFRLFKLIAGTATRRHSSSISFRL